MFVSVDGKAKKVLEIFAGSSNGKAQRVTELFGSVNGIARLLFSAEPPVTNGFDSFSWAEIKQLANEGKLLENFNLYDRVTVKLKTPLEKSLTFYSLLKPDGTTSNVTVEQRQTDMVFQIVELTETKMRLMCPRASVLGLADFDPPIDYHEYMDSRYKLYASNFESNTNYARSYFNDSWGMSKMYDTLKIIQNSLPDDLVNVISIMGRPMISWEKNSVTNSIVKGYDDDFKVGQLSSNKFSKSIKTGEDGIMYPVINESYFPTTITDYLYHITLPEEYDTYENRKKIVTSYFSGFHLPDHELYGDKYFTQSYCTAPMMSCAYTRGLTTNAEYNTFSPYNAGQIITPTKQSENSNAHEAVFPEIVIKAD